MSPLWNGSKIASLASLLVGEYFPLNYNIWFPLILLNFPLMWFQLLLPFYAVDAILTERFYIYMRESKHWNPPRGYPNFSRVGRGACVRDDNQSGLTSIRDRFGSKLAEYGAGIRYGLWGLTQVGFGFWVHMVVGMVLLGPVHGANNTSYTYIHICTCMFPSK